MSIDYMRRVWQNKEFRDGALLLMLALADHANDAGECWPSQPHLEDKTRLTSRHLRRLIDQLASDGYVKIINRGRGRGHKAHYRLFPDPIIKADILSEEKRTICPNPDNAKADISDTKSGHLRQVKADICATKADIHAENQSHARSEPPIEPPIEPSKESSSSDEEDERKRKADPFGAAWQEIYNAPIPADIAKAIAGNLDHCSDAAIIHGIKTAAANGSRNFAYIAKCARNYIPPAPQPPAPSYAVDLPETPGVYALPVATQPQPAPIVAHAPLDHSDPWAVVMAELPRQLPADSPAFAWLAGSTLVKAADVAGVTLYQVQLAGAEGASWLTRQMGVEFRKKLSVLLRQRVLVEIVAAEPQEELTP